MTSSVSPVASLRELAEAATPGPWRAGTTGIEGGDHWHIVDFATMNVVAHIRSDDGDNEDQRPRDARFIAAASPDVVVGFCDLYDEVTRLCENAPTHTDWNGEQIVSARDLRAALSAARVAVERGE